MEKCLPLQVSSVWIVFRLVDVEMQKLNLNYHNWPEILMNKMWNGALTIHLEKRSFIKMMDNVFISVVDRLEKWQHVP